MPNRHSGPSARVLIVLSIAAVAVIATSPPPPTVETHAVGQVVVSGGETIEREVRIQLVTNGDVPESGTIRIGFQTANGLQQGFGPDASIVLLSASDAEGSFTPSADFPVDRCAAGCDLRYVFGIKAGRDVLPGSVVRFDVDVSVHYAYTSSPNATGLRVDVDGATAAPVVPLWSVLAGLVAALLGYYSAGRIDRALGSRRRLPAVALGLVPVLVLAWLIVLERAFSAGALDYLARVGPDPLLLFAFVAPWSLVLLLTLAWGVWRGVQRWPVDGGWSLGLAAVALAGLGGLWWAWVSTSGVVLQPVLHALSFVVLGGLAGIVCGQAWKDHPRGSDRGWGAFAVLGHGIVIAGFGFLAEQSLFDPFATSPQSLLLLIPAALVTLAFRRWLGGGRAWLVLFDLLIALVGLLGVWFVSSLGSVFGTTPGGFTIQDAAIGLAVVASLVALVTSFHEMRPPDRATARSGLGGDQVPTPLPLSPAAPGADPPAG